MTIRENNVKIWSNKIVNEFCEISIMPFNIYWKRSNLVT